MKRNKTPGWVRAIDAMMFSKQPPWGPPVAASLMLSEVPAQPSIEVRCDFCNRHGRYRPRALLEVFGDISMVELLGAIARRGGCPRALSPPATNSISYNLDACKIRRYYPK